jgi:Tfp pilus assembly protein PilZ
LANLYFRRLYIGSEIRRFQRIRYKAYFDIITSHGLKEPSSTVDISEGGLCFISAKPLKTDSTIALKLKLFGSKTLNLKGRVAWIKEAQEPSKAHVFSYMVGVEFIHLGPVQRRILRNFLKPLAS